jgi:hypothetical protein
MCLFAFDRDDTYIHQSRSRSFRYVYLVLLYGTYLRYDVFNRFDNLGLARVAVRDCLGGYSFHIALAAMSMLGIQYPHWAALQAAQQFTPLI